MNSYILPVIALFQIIFDISKCLCVILFQIMFFFFLREGIRCDALYLNGQLFRFFI